MNVRKKSEEFQNFIFFSLALAEENGTENNYYYLHIHCITGDLTSSIPVGQIGI